MSVAGIELLTKRKIHHPSQGDFGRHPEVVAEEQLARRVLMEVGVGLIGLEAGLDDLGATSGTALVPITSCFFDV